MKSAQLVAALLALPFLISAAEAGDAAKGEKDFKRCKACHGLTASDGTVIVRGGKTGPDLRGVIGRKVGSVEGYKYDDALIKLGETGLVWTEENLATYVVDPTAWLQEQTGDASAKSKMSFKLKSGGEDIAAYLATFSTN